MADRKPETQMDREFLQQKYNNPTGTGYYYMAEVLVGGVQHTLFPRQMIWADEELKAGKEIELLVQNAEMGSVFKIKCYIELVNEAAQYTEMYGVKKKPSVSNTEHSGYAVLQFIESL